MTAQETVYKVEMKDVAPKATKYATDKDCDKVRAA